MLESYNFPDNLIKIINRSKSEPFSPLKDIKQGDPISPFLFILSIEILTYLINKEVQGKRWTPFKFRNFTQAFSHLIFADDILLFVKATNKNTKAIANVLNSFSQIFGLNFNTTKSKIWCSPTVPDNMRLNISNSLFFQNSANLGSYLGFPLKPTYHPNDFNFILDKINNKMKIWQSKCLSSVGRSQLISSTSFTIATYYMSALSLPKKIHNKIDKINRNFFWNHSNTYNKIQTIAWDYITKPKYIGGLGLRKSAHTNACLMAKVKWSFLTNKEKISSQILKCKYGNDLNYHRSKCSYVRKSIDKDMNIFDLGIKKLIFNRNETNFWNENWLPIGPLCSRIQGLLPNEHSYTVNQVLPHGMNSNNNFSIPLPLEIFNEINSTPFPENSINNTNIKYSYTWYLSSNGLFSTKSAYQILLSHDNPCFY